MAGRKQPPFPLKAFDHALQEMALGTGERLQRTTIGWLNQGQLRGQKYCSIGSDNFLADGARRFIWRAWAASASSSSARPTPRPSSAAKVIWTPCARAA